MLVVSASRAALHCTALHRPYCIAKVPHLPQHECCWHQGQGTLLSQTAALDEDEHCQTPADAPHCAGTSEGLASLLNDAATGADTHARPAEAGSSVQPAGAPLPGMQHSPAGVQDAAHFVAEGESRDHVMAEVCHACRPVCMCCRLPDLHSSALQRLACRPGSAPATAAWVQLRVIHRQCGCNTQAMASATEQACHRLPAFNALSTSSIEAASDGAALDPDQPPAKHRRQSSDASMPRWAEHRPACGSVDGWHWLQLRQPLRCT